MDTKKTFTYPLGPTYVRCTPATSDQSPYINHYKKHDWKKDKKELKKNTKLLSKEITPSSHKRKSKSQQKCERIIKEKKENDSLEKDKKSSMKHKSVKKKRNLAQIKNFNIGSYFVPETPKKFQKVTLVSDVKTKVQCDNDQNTILHENKMASSRLVSENNIIPNNYREDNLKCRKIRMYPTKEQRKVLNDWFSDCQRVWNQATHYINTHKELLSIYGQLQKKEEKQEKSISLNSSQNESSLERKYTFNETRKRHRKRKKDYVEEKENKKNKKKTWRKKIHSHPLFQMIQDKKMSKQYKIKWTCKLKELKEWDRMRKKFTLRSEIVKQISYTRTEKKLNIRITKLRTPVDILQQTLRTMKGNFDSAFSNLIKGHNPHFRFRFHAKENHYKPSSSDSISIPARATKLFSFEEKTHQILSDLQIANCQEYKSFKKRFGNKLETQLFEESKLTENIQGANDQEIFINKVMLNRDYYSWKKEKLVQRYKLQDKGTHLITHFQSFTSYLQDPIAIYPFPYPKSNEFLHDIKIVKRKGQFYLIVPFLDCEYEEMRSDKDKECIESNIEFDETLKTTISKDTKRFNCGAFDPGINTPFTGYSPEGMIYEIGNPEFKKQIQNLHKRQDKIKLHLDTNQTDRKFLPLKSYLKKRRKKHRQWKKIQRYKENMVKDFHWKTAKFLRANFNHIILPRFGTKEMMRRISYQGQQRKISKSTTRLLQALSFGKFRQRLASSQRSGSLITHIGSEWLTSRTCGIDDCWHINGPKPYSSRFKCDQCNTHLNRDMHSAWLIYNLNVAKREERKENQV